MSFEKSTGSRVPPDITSPASCAVCGCRLQKLDEIEGWSHYSSAEPGQDARGCRTACLDKVHDRLGQPREDAVPS